MYSGKDDPPQHLHPENNPIVTLKVYALSYTLVLCINACQRKTRQVRWGAKQVSWYMISTFNSAYLTPCTCLWKGSVMIPIMFAILRCTFLWQPYQYYSPFQTPWLCLNGGQQRERWLVQRQPTSGWDEGIPTRSRIQSQFACQSL